MSNPLITPGTTAIAKPANTASTRLRTGLAELGAPVENMRGYYRRKAHGKSDGQIDSSRNDDESLAKTQQKRSDRENRDGFDVKRIEQKRAVIHEMRPDLESDQKNPQEKPRSKRG